METRLYFGLGPAADPAKGISESEWRRFLDESVTPLFPAGFSVEEAYGQWQTSPKDPVERLRSKVLIVDFPATPDNRRKVERVRSDWKRKTGDLSVLRVTQNVDVSF